MATAEIRDGCDDARKRKAARAKEWREAHKSEQAAYHKEYREAHKSERAAQHKEYHKSHKSERAAYCEAHKSKIAARQKKYNEAHKSEIAARHKGYCESISDGYVAQLLRLPTELIPPEMIEMKRNRMKLTRELVILKKAIKGE